MNEKWFKINSAPTTGRKLIWLKITGREPQLAYSDTWWIGGFSVECKPTHWKPIHVALRRTATLPDKFCCK